MRSNIAAWCLGWLKVSAVGALLFTISTPTDADSAPPSSTKVKVFIGSFGFPIKAGGAHGISVEGFLSSYDEELKLRSNRGTLWPSANQMDQDFTSSRIKKISIDESQTLSLRAIKLAWTTEWLAEIKNPLPKKLIQISMSTASAAVGPQPLAQTLIFNQGLIRLDGTDGAIEINGKKWPSPVYLLATAPGHADAVLSLDLDKYLEGVLAGEMPMDWPMETLKAQAIAARSYAIAQIKYHQTRYFQVRGDVLDQVFLPTHTIVNDAHMQRVRQAIQETRSLVLSSGGQVVKAFYHSDCGGKPEAPENVWGAAHLTGGGQGKAFISHALSRENYYDFHAPHKWTFAIKKRELFGILKAALKENVEKMEVAKFSESGRVESLNLKTRLAFGERKQISGQDLRQLVGFGKIKSTLFKLQETPTAYVFTGKGLGHGSGLCQWGARALAMNGRTAEGILKYYYPGARIESLESLKY